MVLYFNKSHNYDFPFAKVSLAYINRYPNPFASHVLSADTIERHIDEQGRLHTTRLIRKRGKLPSWAKPFLGKINHSYIVEKSIIDPVKKEMLTYTKNMEHTRIIQVEEYGKYVEDGVDGTKARFQVIFSSNFGKNNHFYKNLNLRDRIENWSHNRFHDSFFNSVKGMSFVLKQLSHKGLDEWRSRQLMGNFNSSS